MLSIISHAQPCGPTPPSYSLNIVCYPEPMGDFNPQSYSNDINDRNLICNFDNDFL